MNVPRIVALLRELADALEEGAPANDTAPAKRPKKARPRAKAFPPPLHPPTDLDRMRARKMLRARGLA